MPGFFYLFPFRRKFFSARLILSPEGRRTIELNELFTGKAAHHLPDGGDRPPQRPGDHAGSGAEGGAVSAGPVRAGFRRGRLHGFQRHRHRAVRPAQDAGAGRGAGTAIHSAAALQGHEGVGTGPADRTEKEGTA